MNPLAVTSPSKSPVSGRSIGSACAHACERRLGSGVGRAWRAKPAHISLDQVEERNG